MKCALIFTLLAVAACSALAAPLELNNLLSGLAVEQQPEQDVVKRQVQANPDGALKQISFQALIGNLENSLFQSALSLNGASAPDSQVAEVTPAQSVTLDSNDHAVSKRSDEHVTTTEIVAVTEAIPDRKILLQTTKKVPLSEDGVPAHLIIDHVSVQPHNGASLPLLPLFQVHHTKITSATIKDDPNNDSSDGKQTKISITKTSITSTAPVESVEVSSSSAKPELVSSTTVAATTTTTTAAATTTTEQTTESSTSKEDTSSSSTTTTSTTTEKSAEKDEEQKLKEKVAEVEADPVILTSRV